MSDNDKVTLPTEASDVTQGDGPVLEERYIQPLADIYKVLGDPTRLRILHVLLHNEVCVYDISRKIDMGQSAVSHQLRILRNARWYSSDEPARRYTTPWLIVMSTPYWK